MRYTYTWTSTPFLAEDIPPTEGDCWMRLEDGRTYDVRLEKDKKNKELTWVVFKETGKRIPFRTEGLSSYWEKVDTSNVP